MTHLRGLNEHRSTPFSPRGGWRNISSFSIIANLQIKKYLCLETIPRRFFIMKLHRPLQVQAGTKWLGITISLFTPGSGPNPSLGYPPPAFNPLHLNICIYILHTVLYTFPMVLTKRICLTIKNLSSWWSVPLFLWPSCLIQGRHCKEKLDAGHSWGSMG